MPITTKAVRPEYRAIVRATEAHGGGMADWSITVQYKADHEQNWRPISTQTVTNVSRDGAERYAAALVQGFAETCPVGASVVRQDYSIAWGASR